MNRVLAIVLGVVSLVVIAASLVALLTVRQYHIPSESMKPTLPLNSNLWTLPADGSRVGRGDIIVWETQNDGGAPSRVTRVVAVAGDTVESIDDRLQVNGQPVAEDYLAPGTPTENIEKSVVPPEAVYVLGDNRTNSKDSRFIGPVPTSQIVARALVVNAPNKLFLFGAVAIGVFGVLFSWSRYRRGSSRETIAP